MKPDSFGSGCKIILKGEVYEPEKVFFHVKGQPI